MYIHMRLIADFPSPWGNTAQELKVLESGNWHPTTVDFRAVAMADGGKSPHTYTIRTVHDMLDSINSVPDDSILALSIITHATEGLIGISGKVEATGAVHLQSRDNSLESPGIDQSIVDKGGLLNNQAMGSDTPERRLRNKARKKLHDNAVMIIYGCNSGNSTMNYNLLRWISRTFNVTVYGFKRYIMYTPEIERGVWNRTLTTLASSPGDRSYPPPKRGVGHLVPEVQLMKVPDMMYP